MAQRYVREPFLMDGWRLDVAETIGRQDDVQVHHEVWPEFRASVKGANPDAYIMGEAGVDASELLQGNELDAVMNYYGFCTPLRQWLSGNIVFEPESDGNHALKMGVEDFDAWLKSARAAVPYAVSLSMYNMMGSHDCARILYHLANDIRKLKMALVFQFGYVGVPALYYGDEIGMSGTATNESARSCMEWNEKNWNMDVFELVRKLCALRRKSAALQKGGMSTVSAKDNVYWFARFLKNENVLVVMNNSAESVKSEADLTVLSVGSGARFKDEVSGEVFTAENHRLALHMEPYSARILTA